MGEAIASVVYTAHFRPSATVGPHQTLAGQWRCPPGEAYAEPLGLTYPHSTEFSGGEVQACTDSPPKSGFVG